mgnify:CR=1 FL=1
MKEYPHDKPYTDNNEHYGKHYADKIHDFGEPHGLGGKQFICHQGGQSDPDEQKRYIGEGVPQGIPIRKGAPNQVERIKRDANKRNKNKG